MNKKALPYIFLAVLALLVLCIRNISCGSTVPKKETTHVAVKQERGLPRTPSHINYSKHARCRMECRHITEAEVKQIIEEGKVNYKKSNLQKPDCQKRYAVEGVSKDNQHLRIIAVPCNSELTIVTCIDIDTEWQCNCEGDEAMH